MGCHDSKASAVEQLKALYVNDPNAKKGQNAVLPKFERRYGEFELRLDGTQQKPIITGHAAVFNQKSLPIPGLGVREVVRPGTFSKTINSSDIRALWNHNPDFILARTKNGTLSLAEDSHGLAVRITPADTVWASDLVESIRRGDVDQMSFGFKTIQDNWPFEDGERFRELLEVELFDVSPVTFPAYPQTDVAARSYFEARMAELDTEKSEQREEFLARQAARKAFIDARTPPPDPDSLAEIIKRARMEDAEHGS